MTDLNYEHALCCLFQVEVHFVDFGNTEVISLRTIVFLSHEILSLVPFAQLYCLDGVVTNRHLSDQVKGIILGRDRFQ